MNRDFSLKERVENTREQQQIRVSFILILVLRQEKGLIK